MRQTSTSIAALLLLAACNGTQMSDTTASPAAAQPSLEAADTAPEPAAGEEAESESERLNAWFEEQFQEAVARSPMMQTYLGIKTDYGKWDDPSDEEAIKEMEIQRDAVAEMKSGFDYDALDEQAQLSWRLAEYELERAEAAFPYRHYGYTFNQMFGVQSGIPAFLVNQHRVTSESDAEAYISRLEGVEAYLGQHVENLVIEALALGGIVFNKGGFERFLAQCISDRGVEIAHPLAMRARQADRFSKAQPPGFGQADIALVALGLVGRQDDR